MKWTRVINTPLAAEAWETDSIQKGYAQYCADTGAWAWAGECEE